MGKTLRDLWVFIILTVFVSGCAHPLTVKNIGMYKPEFVNSQNLGHKIGLVSSTESPVDERLLMTTANALKRDGFNVICPFYSNGNNHSEVDYIVDLNLSSEFKGSGANFWINWPGFLIWTPAWHGYKYGADFDVMANIVNTDSGNEVCSLDFPIDLDIRHAAMNRTWTEISWIEWSAIAFVGGLMFMKYDETVTPLLMDKYEHRLGEYISSKIAKSIISDVETLKA